MSKDDSIITDFDHPPETEDYNIIEFLRNMHNRVLQHMELEEQRMKDPSWRYEQVWIIPPGSIDEFPENPTWRDFAEAGASFAGWQWVKVDEESPGGAESEIDDAEETQRTDGRPEPGT